MTCKSQAIALLFLVLLGCRTAEDACVDLCDKAEDCDSSVDEQACADECIDDIADDDSVSDKCRDAFVEFVDCTNTLTCDAIAADEPPAKCADEHAALQDECYAN